MRRRGPSYIWIDSLCTFQDSGEDWSQEASEMGGSYANSYCTFAAMDSSHDNSDTFHSRLSREHRSHTIEDGDIIPIESQLDTRPCTSQEFILSPRDLAQRSMGRVWKCNEWTADELHQFGVCYSPTFNRESSLRLLCAVPSLAKQSPGPAINRALAGLPDTEPLHSLRHESLVALQWFIARRGKG